MTLNSRAQNIGEYAIIIAIIGAALVTMQAYLARSIQGVIKLSTDEIGVQENEDFNIRESTELYSESGAIETSSSLETVRLHGLMDTSHTERNTPVDFWPEYDYLKFNMEFTGSTLRDMRGSGE
jgi:hypothetical protein